MTVDSRRRSRTVGFDHGAQGHELEFDSYPAPPGRPRQAPDAVLGRERFVHFPAADFMVIEEKCADLSVFGHADSLADDSSREPGARDNVPLFRPLQGCDQGPFPACSIYLDFQAKTQVREVS